MTTMLLASTAFAGGPPPFSGGGDSSATSNATGVGVGVGVGIGKGGNASSSANAVGVNKNTNVNSNKAYGGNANVGVSNRNSNFGVNRQGQIGINKATGSGNKTDVSFSSTNNVDAEPAIAPGIQGDVSNLTCMAHVGGSVAGGGIFALGIQAVYTDDQCTYRANLPYVQRLFGQETARNYAHAYLQDPKGVLDAETEEEVAAILKHDKTAAATAVSSESTARKGDVHNPYGL